MQKLKLDDTVTQFIDGLNHPLKEEITQLRQIILAANNKLSENIKWNGPNYRLEAQDRITMRVQPFKQVQLIFHRGAKVLTQPPDRFIKDTSGLLIWKANDRAVASFKTIREIESGRDALSGIINNWLAAADSA
jgi:hypothetical protein